MTTRKTLVRDALASWIALNEKISEFTEDEVLLAMEMENERPGGRRETFIERLEQRRRGIRIEEVREELK